MADLVTGDLPQATVEREITPDDVVEVINKCMTESGFVVNEDGATQLMPGQEQDYWRAAYVCHVRFPIEERFTGPPTQEQYALRYEHWTTTLLPCWAGLGIVPTEPPPSLEAFLGDVHAWRPEDVTEQARSAWMQQNGTDQEDLDRLCPREPALDVLDPPG